MKSGETLDRTARAGRMKHVAGAVVVVGMLIAGLAGVVAAQADSFACTVERSGETVTVSWTNVADATSYQYRIQTEGRGNRYRTTEASSVSLEIPEGSIVAMTPIFADRQSPPRVVCDSLPLPSDDPDDSDRPVYGCTLTSVEGGVQLRWDAVDGATGYRYLVRMNGRNHYFSVSNAAAQDIFVPTDDVDAQASFVPNMTRTYSPILRRVDCRNGRTNPAAPVATVPTTVPPATAAPTTEVPTTVPSPSMSTPLSTIPADAASGPIFHSASGPVLSNGSERHSDTGEQCMSDTSGSNEPGLRYGDFLVKNNAWNEQVADGDWKQCIGLTTNADGSVSTRWTWDWLAETDVIGPVWQVRSYPEVIYGSKSAFEESGTRGRTGLPALHHELPQFQIDYSYTSENTDRYTKELNGSTINGEKNVAIESFFHTSCDIRRGSSGSNRAFEVMLWLERGPERDPDGRTGLKTVTTIDGAQYEVWTKGEKDPAYIAFVAVEPQSEGSIDWTAFLEWARVNGSSYGTAAFEDDWCLANIIFGTEIWWGEGSFQLDRFDITRTYS